jgi:type IV secretory pathway VirB2 component (pilin)
VKEKARQWLALFRANPGVALALLAMWGMALAGGGGGGGGGGGANPLAGALTRIRNILCGTVDTLTGPFGTALAVFMLALGFAGLIIGNRNSMGLIITAIAGGALLLAAKTLGPAIVGGAGC